MPQRAAHRGDTVSYRNARGETFNATVYGEQITPAQPTSSTSTTGGTLAAATYSYRLTAVVGGTESAPSTAKTQVTTGATSTVTIDWSATAVPGATAHKVYGRTGGSELLMGTVNMPTTSFTDTGAVTPSGALPTATGAVSLKIRGGGNAMVNQVPKATSYKQTGVYFNR
jgi:hypothetical protein